MPEAECKVCHANSFIADDTHEGSHVICNTCEEERELKKLGTKWYLTRLKDQLIHNFISIFFYKY